MIGPTQVIAGSADVSIVIRVMQNTAGGTNPGDPLTGLAAADIAMQYRRDGATASGAITDSDIALNAAHTDGGFEEIGEGYYRFDVADAAFAVGVRGVLLFGTVTNATVYAPYIQLQDPVAGLYQSHLISSASTSVLRVADFTSYADDELIGELVQVYDSSTDEWHPAWVTDFASANGDVTVEAARGGGVLPFTSESGVDRLARTGLSRDGIATFDLTAYDPPTNAEMEARTLAAASYATATALQTVDDEIATIDGNVDTLLTRITSTLFGGITSLAEWLGLIAGKQTGDSTARTELRATGAGSGTFDETTDSVEAIRDQGDAAWTTGAGGSAPTVGEIADAVWDEAKSGHTSAGSFGEEVQAHALTSEVTAVGDDTDELLTRLPDATPGGNGGLPTVDANNRIAGIQGTITDLDGLGTAQDAQHATTQSAVADVPTNAELTSALAAADDAVLAAIGDIDTLIDEVLTKLPAATVDGLTPTQLWATVLASCAGRIVDKTASPMIIQNPDGTQTRISVTPDRAAVTLSFTGA